MEAEFFEAASLIVGILQHPLCSFHIAFSKRRTRCVTALPSMGSKVLKFGGRGLQEQAAAGKISWWKEPQ